MNSVRLNTVNLGSVGLNTTRVSSIGIGGKRQDAIPKAIKDAMVCWYDPKKQGLTNEDIVTKYKVGFKKYMTAGNAAVVTFTDTIIAINNTSDIKSNFYWGVLSTTIGEEYNVPEYRINVSGLNDKTLKYVYFEGVDFSIRKELLLKDGINTIPASSVQVKSNNLGYRTNFEYRFIEHIGYPITITQLPTSILQDFSGNDRVGYCYNFAGSGYSGVGLYPINFTKDFSAIAGNAVIKDYKTVEANKTTAGGYIIYKTVVDNTGTNLGIPDYPTFKIKISNYIGGGGIYFKYVQENGQIAILSMPSNGEYIIPKSFNSKVTSTNFLAIGINCDLGAIFTVEQIPDYPNQLVFDGIDDYIYCPNQPILTDYTVMAARTTFKDSKGALASKVTEENPKGFIFEGGKSFQSNTWSFGSSNNVSLLLNERITWQSKNSYNGTYIKSGLTPDITDMTIGGFRYWKGAFEQLIVFNRSLTTDEIDWIKNNLMK